jgi:hypothetical protein
MVLFALRKVSQQERDKAGPSAEEESS